MTQFFFFTKQLQLNQRKLVFFLEHKQLLRHELFSKLVEFVSKPNFSESCSKTDVEKNLSKSIASKALLSNVVCFTCSNKLLGVLVHEDEEKKI